MKKYRAMTKGGLVFALSLGMALGTPAYAKPMERLIDGPDRVASGAYPRITPDARYVVFESASERLGVNDNNGFVDIFRHDRENGALTRVSTSTTDEQANGGSSGAEISADGRFVVFSSWASNLVSGDVNGDTDAFLKDTQTGVIELLNVTGLGDQQNDSTHFPDISGDGRYVVFLSAAGKALPGQAWDPKLYLLDRNSGSTRRISNSTDKQSDHLPNISENGEWVAYIQSTWSGPKDDPQRAFVEHTLMIYNAKTGETTPVHSPHLSGRTLGKPRISGDGRYVVFDSWPNLSEPVPDSFYDEPVILHIYDRETGEVSTPSLQLPKGEWGILTCKQFVAGHCRYDYLDVHVLNPSISANGRFISFEILDLSAFKTFLDPPPYWLPLSDVFVHDRVTQTTSEITVQTYGSAQSDVSDNGTVVFASIRNSLYASTENETYILDPAGYSNSPLYVSDKAVRRLGLPRWYTRDLPFFAPQEPVNGIAPDAIEVPRHGEIYYGISVLRGWRLSGEPVDLYIDEKRRLTLNADGKRGDVTQAAGLPPDRGVGWSLAFNMGLLQPGWHVLELRDPQNGQTLARTEFISDALPFFSAQGERAKFVSGLEQMLNIKPSTNRLDNISKQVTLRWDTPKQGWSISDYSISLPSLLGPPSLSTLTPPAVPETAIEVPAADQIYYGIVNLRGWRLSGKSLLVCFDQGSCHPLAADGKRGDVTGAAGLPADQGVGWAMAFNAGLLQPGQHLMTLYDLESGGFLASREFSSGRLPYTDTLGNSLPFVHRTPQEISVPGPLPGHRAMLQWRDATQGYEIIDYENPDHPETPPSLVAIPTQTTSVGADFFLALSDYTLISEGEEVLGYRANGPLPEGLGFDSTFGVFTGRAAQAGSYSVPVRAWDNDGWSNSRNVLINVQ